jgi:hypothetical protein
LRFDRKQINHRITPKALIEASKDKAIAEEKNVLGLALFDHEEVGNSWIDFVSHCRK